MRIKAIIAALLLLTAPAYAQKSKAVLQSEVTASFPDQVTGAITPAIVRGVFSDFINSWQQYTAVNNQAGTSYTLQVGDYGSVVKFNNSGAIAVSIPAPTGSFLTFNSYIYNSGAGTITVTPTSATINGLATLTINAGTTYWIFSDGTGLNYLAFAVNMPLPISLANGGLGGSQAAATAGQISVFPGSGGAAVPTSFLQAGTGAVARTWNAKDQDYLTVQDFGVKCDGSTDDTANIIIADAAAAAQSKALRFPGGTCRVSSAITPSSSAHWIGDSYQYTNLQTTSGTANVLNISNSFFTIEQFQISASVARTAGIYLNVTGTNFSAYHVYAQGAYQALVFGSAVSVVYVNDFQSLNAVTTTGVDIVVNGCLQCVLENVLATNAGGAKPFAHLNLVNTGDFTCIACNFILAANNVYINPGNGQTVSSVKFLGGFLDQGGIYNLVAVPSGTGVWARSSFLNTWFSQAGTGNFILGPTNASIINGIDCTSCEFYGSINGIGITQGAATATNIQFNNGRIAGASGSGVSINGAGNVAFNGIKIGSTGGFGVNATGVTLAGTIAIFQLENSDLTGSTTPITNGATITTTIIRNNAPLNVNGILPVAEGGTGISSLGTGVATALGVNIGTAGAFVVNGGALGSPSSAGTIPAFTLGGTITGGGNQINNVIIGTSTPLAGTFTALTATSVAINGLGTHSVTSTAGSGTVVGWTGSYTRNTTSGTTDNNVAFQYTATDQGTTTPNSFVAFKMLPTLSNANNTSSFNYGFQLAAQTTANATLLYGLESTLTAFGGTLGTFAAYHVSAPTAAGGTVTTKYAFLSDANAGPIVQNDTTASTSKTTGAVIVAGGIGVGGKIVSDTLNVITLANTATTSAVCYNTGTGLFTYDGTIGTCTVSDERLKNMGPRIDHALDKLLAINGVYGTWKDPAMGAGRQIFIGAQTAERVFPELVQTDSDGKKSLDYQRLTAPIIEALRELKADNDSLRAEINEIKRATR